MNPNEVLVQAMTADQQETVSSYPTQAVQYAVSRMRGKGKKVNFAYFMGVVKSYLSQAGNKKTTQPYQKQTASSTNQQQPEYDTSHLRKERPAEDPFEAVVTICENLTTTTTDPRYGDITPEMKMKVAQPDPWWTLLDDSQKQAILERYPSYALVLGKQSHGLFKSIHDRNLEQFEQDEIVHDTKPPVELHESPFVIDELDEVATTMSTPLASSGLADNTDDYVNYNPEFHTLFGDRQ